MDEYDKQISRRIKLTNPMHMVISLNKAIKGTVKKAQTEPLLGKKQRMTAIYGFYEQGHLQGRTENGYPGPSLLSLAFCQSLWIGLLSSPLLWQTKPSKIHTKHPPRTKASAPDQSIPSRQKHPSQDVQRGQKEITKRERLLGQTPNPEIATMRRGSDMMPCAMPATKTCMTVSPSG